MIGLLRFFSLAARASLVCVLHRDNSNPFFFWIEPIYTCALGFFPPPLPEPPRSVWGFFPPIAFFFSQSRFLQPPPFSFLSTSPFLQLPLVPPLSPILLFDARKRLPPFVSLIRSPDIFRSTSHFHVNALACPKICLLQVPLPLCPPRIGIK